MQKRITRRDFIIKTSHLLGLSGLTGSGTFFQSCKLKKEFTILIKNAQVVDILKNKLIFTDIGITGNIIKTMGKISESRAEVVIEAKGKFIIPGLIDMHVHFTDQAFSELFLSNGVTSVRDLGNETSFILSLRDKINSGKLEGPSIYASGPIINNRKIPYGASFYTIVVKNEEEARRVIRSLAEKKVDWIKIYMTLPGKLVRTIIMEAQKNNLPVAGHLRKTDARFAAKCGIKTLEHTTGIAEALLGKKDFVDAPPLQTISDRVWLHVDKTKYNSLIELLVKKEVYILANLTVFEILASPPEKIKDVSDVKLMPPHFIKKWKNFIYYRKKNPENWKMTKNRIEEFLLLFKNKGGKILAGTDTPWPLLIPGISLHRELELLVEAGLSSQEALLAATFYPAEALGQMKNIGTIEEGKRADLIILKKNPLHNISNTKNIEITIKDGKIIHRKEQLPRIPNRYMPSYFK